MTKATPGKATPGKAATGKAATGKAAPGKATSSKAPRKATSGKAAVGKAAPGKAAPEKATSVKAVAGTAAPGKAERGTAAPGTAVAGTVERGTAALGTVERGMPVVGKAPGKAAPGKAAAAERPVGKTGGGKGAAGKGARRGRDGSRADGSGGGGGEGAGGGKGRVSRRKSGGRDPLATYRGMRDPERTPEPVPAAGPLPEGNDDTFVIQEHHARSLHWDVRLERDGVLVSWAVPKGLPLNPKENRLAVHTEDHPIDYGSFEGDIPAGEYGGGKVVLWDRGRYEMEEWTDREVKVVFHGNRAEGRYVFFQTRGSDWMVHRMDGPPFPDWQPVPTELTPMTATKGPLPSGGRRQWAYELAWAGNRILVAVEGGRIRVRDEKGRDVSAAYPELRAMGAELGSTVCLLDGEVVALGKDGRPDPSLLRRRPARQAAPGAKDLREVPITFLAFDLLHLDGRDLIGRPYEERRAALETLGLEGDRWGVAPAVPGTGRDALKVAHGLGLNGVVAKRRRSLYRSGVTTADWILTAD